MPAVLAALQDGLVIPAHPLALTPTRTLDERRQRALMPLLRRRRGRRTGRRRAHDAVRHPRPAVGLFEPVLDAGRRRDGSRRRAAGPSRSCGSPASAAARPQAVRRGRARSRASATTPDCSASRRWPTRTTTRSSRTARPSATCIPLVGFYLQPAVGGRPLPYAFWRRFAEIRNVVAIKIAPFNRYQTIDVVRAVAEAGRDDIALYTGNDDNIVLDLLTPFRFAVDGRAVERRIVGGLLGHWAVWTQTRRRAARRVPGGGAAPAESRPSCCDAASSHRRQRGVLRRRQRLRRLHRRHPRSAAPAGARRSARCLSADEALSPGQAAEIDRVCRAYPHLADDAFVRANLDEWLRC